MTHFSEIPEVVAAIHKALRGDCKSVREQWVSFDPQHYHCVEPVTSGDRRSLALLPPEVGRDPFSQSRRAHGNWFLSSFHDSECGS